MTASKQILSVVGDRATDKALELAKDLARIYLDRRQVVTERSEMKADRLQTI